MSPGKLCELEFVVSCLKRRNKEYESWILLALPKYF